MTIKPADNQAKASRIGRRPVAKSQGQRNERLDPLGKGISAGQLAEEANDTGVIALTPID